MFHKLLLISKNVIFFSITSRHPSSDWGSSITTNTNVSGRSYFSMHFRIRVIKEIKSTRRVINIIFWYNQIRASYSRADGGIVVSSVFFIKQINFSVEAAQEISYFKIWPGTKYLYSFVIFKIIFHNLHLHFVHLVFIILGSLNILFIVCRWSTFD